MLEDNVSQNVYSNDNHRFRKAYIRERLAALKAEREALIAEREKIDELRVAAKKPTANSTARDHAVN